jgi:lysophospholipase L1-like esterase
MLSVLSLLFAGLVLEGALRLLDPQGLSYFAEMSRHILDRLPDPDLKWRNRPNLSARYQGVQMRFNELGLRDDPVGPKTSDEFRILLLGDSQTLGWGVEHDSTWGARLQRILSDRLRHRVRVINAGVAGYETRQEYRYLMRDGLALSPDLILLMYLDNDLKINDRPYDPWSEERLSDKPPYQVLYLLVRKLRLYQLVWYWSGLGQVSGGKKYDPRQELGPLPLDFDPAIVSDYGWQESMKHLNRLAVAARERSIGFAVVHYDWVRFPFSLGIDSAIKAQIAPFPVAYVPDWFEGKDVRKYFNSPTDAHPNAAACAILAERIADFVISRSLAPTAGSK